MSDEEAAGQSTKRRVHIVPHTHWDREWYSPYQTFRLRLVDLLDQLLPQLEGDPSYAHFLLDGQMAVVDDYLAVRPEAEPRLRGPRRHRPHGDGAVVRAARRVPRVRRDARAQPAARAPGGQPLRRRHGRRLPARHVRPRRPDAAAAPAVRLRARGGVAGRAVGDRPQRLLVDGARRLHGAGRVPAPGLRQRRPRARRRQGARAPHRRVRGGAGRPAHRPDPLDERHRPPHAAAVARPGGGRGQRPRPRLRAPHLLARRARAPRAHRRPADAGRASSAPVPVPTCSWAWRRTAST